MRKLDVQPRNGFFNGWRKSCLSVGLPDEFEPVRTEMFRYRSRWVDMADACLVIMSDSHPRLPVVTVDAKDFAVYFRGRSTRQLLAPEKRE